MIEEISCKYFNDNLCKSCTRLNNITIDSAKRLPELPKELIKLANKVKPWVLINEKNPFNLRAKARLSVTLKNNEIILGILDKKLQGISLLECPQHRKVINNALKYLPLLIKESGLIPYSINLRTGELKSIIIQTNKNEDHLRFRFVLRSEEQINLVRDIGEKLIDILNIKISVSANIQDIPHQIPEGPTEYQLLGEQYLWESYRDVKVALPNQSFMQVTPEVAERLYYDASQIVSQYKDPVVLDYFSGAGGFALSVAKNSKKVCGIELSKDAVIAARLSVEENKIENVVFTETDLLNSAEHLQIIKPDILICNPPRRGLGAKVIESILSSPPNVFIYSSCNPLSFLSDFNVLANNYEILEITPYEMFPLTEHFEVLVHMKRIN